MTIKNKTPETTETEVDGIFMSVSSPEGGMERIFIPMSEEVAQRVEDGYWQDHAAAMGLELC